MTLPRLLTTMYASNRIFTVQEVPYKPVAIIFGAGLRRDGSPTLVLRERVETGAALYKTGKIEKLLMSGDNRSENYDEPSAMRRYAVQLGIPEEDIVLDYAGLRTYDTCYRARHIFGLDEVVLVTQNFHLPRTIFTCNQLGISAIGVVADRVNYRRSAMLFWNIRETLATLVAVWDVKFARPAPVLGSPEPIFPPEA